jgi:hypothetical protein
VIVPENTPKGIVPIALGVDDTIGNILFIAIQ